MKKKTPKESASEKANPSPSDPVGTGAAAVSGVERLRRVCEILQCCFSVALDTCDNDILKRGDIAAGLCEIINCGVSFSDCEIDLELRRIAPLAIAERNEKLNDIFCVHRDPPAITDFDIEEFIKDFSAEETTLARVRVFGDLAGTEIKYIDDPKEIRARKTDYIIEWNTRDFRRTFGQWLYFSRTETISDLAGELRRKCSAKEWQNDRQEVINNFVAVSRLREIAFIANAESRRAKLAQGANPSARDTANPSESVAPVANKSARRRVGMSQAAFSALLKHYGGKCHGERYSPRIVQGWELWERTGGRKGTEPPTAGGVKYCAALRDKESAALNWAGNFNIENENAYKARNARI